MKSLELMLKNGNYVDIATHDKYLIDKSYELITKHSNIQKTVWNSRCCSESEKIVGINKQRWIQDKNIRSVW